MALFPPERETSFDVLSLSESGFSTDEQIMVISEKIEDLEYTFDVNGFDYEHWPLDVSYDMSMIIEQLEHISAMLGAGRDFEIRFDGYRLVISCKPRGGAVEMNCRSDFPNRGPTPGTRCIDTMVLASMFCRLSMDFLKASNEVASGHDLGAWSERIVASLRPDVRSDPQR